MAVTSFLTMGPKNLNFSSIARCLLAAVTLVSSAVHAADAPKGKLANAAGATSARLFLSATVVPTVQTSKPSPGRPATIQNIYFDFAPQHYESRYRVRELPIEKASGSDLVPPAVLQTLTIVPK